MIFGVALEVFGQMLDPAREKCDLHIRAARIFFMQLELLEAQRLRALCHYEVPTLNEERALATTIGSVRRWHDRYREWLCYGQQATSHAAPLTRRRADLNPMDVADLSLGGLRTATALARGPRISLFFETSAPSTTHRWAFLALVRSGSALALNIQRCLFCLARLAYDLAKVQAEIVRNFAPAALTSFEHCHDFANVFARFGRHQVCNQQVSITEPVCCLLRLERSHRNAGLAGNRHQDAGASILCLCPSVDIDGRSLELRGHVRARNSGADHQEECRND